MPSRHRCCCWCAADVVDVVAGTSAAVTAISEITTASK